MWIFAREGFFSVVEDPRDNGKVLVRARRREDLAALRLGKILETPMADYGFRCRVPKLKWADKMLELSLAIDYPNFKNAAKAQGNSTSRIGSPGHRDKLYGEVWLTMQRLQEIPPYGTPGFELRDEVARKIFDDKPPRRQKNEGQDQAHQPRKGLRFHQKRKR